MSDLQTELLKVVQENLGSMEVASIKQLIEDNEDMQRLRTRVEDQDQKLIKYREKAFVRDDEMVQLSGQIEALNKELSHAQSQIREMEKQHAVFDYLMEDRGKLFDIVGSAYKHYTHTTTRQEMVSGGQYLGQGFDGNGNSLTIPLESEPVVNTLTEETTTT